MLHVRIDDNELNIHRKFACGIGPELPEGDQWVYASELRAARADCPGCNPAGPRPLGIPISALNGNASARHDDPAAWERWVAFCERNGHP
jgi:hypothetical protein